jgi:hypothetical protein
MFHARKANSEHWLELVNEARLELKYNGLKIQKELVKKLT